MLMIGDFGICEYVILEKDEIRTKKYERRMSRYEIRITLHASRFTPHNQQPITDNP